MTTTHSIQSAINEGERTIEPKMGRGYRVSIYQHELEVLVAAANECVKRRIEDEEMELQQERLKEASDD